MSCKVLVHVTMLILRVLCAQILDGFLEQQIQWWLSPSPSYASRLASGAAEARSLICLFYLECLARLTTPLILLTSKSRGAYHRVAQMLRFALDHASNAARISESPANIISANICLVGPHYVSGRIHSRENHLQVSVLSLIAAIP